jgi:cobalt/nickel transport system permease protein
VHVPDGFLEPRLTLPALAAAAPLWAWAARRHLGASAVDRLPLLGSLTALALVVQTIAIPVPGGTSTHVVGAALLAILEGPLAAFACESLVLAVQALFLGAGGFTVLGVNALAMGLLGPVAAFAVHRAARRAWPRAAAFAAAWLAAQASTLAVALVLALQHRLSPAFYPVPPEVTFAAMLVPSVAVTGVAEGLYTVFALALLRRSRLLATTA